MLEKINAPTPKELVDAVNNCVNTVNALTNATTTKDGFMSAEDKVALDTLVGSAKTLAEQITSLAELTGALKTSVETSIADLDARVTALEPPKQ